MSMTVEHKEPRSSDARRALVLHDRPLVVDLIELTLNHGVFVVRPAHTLAEADAILRDWQPHLAVIDMDHDDSTELLGRLGASSRLTKRTTPAQRFTATVPGRGYRFIPTFSNAGWAVEGDPGNTPRMTGRRSH